MQEVYKEDETKKDVFKKAVEELNIQRELYLDSTQLPKCKRRFYKKRKRKLQNQSRKINRRK